MNHYVLPSSQGVEDSLRYGDVALERMLARMVELGCDPRDLRAKVFGGAAVLPFGDGETVGTKNTRTAIEWLRAHAIPVTARRTGGRDGLLIRFFTSSGKVLVRRVESGTEISTGGQVPSCDSLQIAGVWGAS
jgi:chemotaxis protein CheD